MCHSVGIILICVQHREWIRTDLKIADFVPTVVLHYKRSSAGNIIQQSFVISAQVFTDRVGANAEDNGRKLRQVSSRNVFRRKDCDIDAQLLQSVRDGVTGTRDIPYR